MLLIYGDEKTLSDEARQSCYVESTNYCHELNEAGKFVATAPLQSVSTASSIRVREGKPIVTDGPFAETREQLGGFFMVDVKDHAEAIEVAKRIPGARWGTVEVRPVVELPNVPA